MPAGSARPRGWPGRAGIPGSAHRRSRTRPRPAPGPRRGEGRRMLRGPRSRAGSRCPRTRGWRTPAGSGRSPGAGDLAAERGVVEDGQVEEDVDVLGGVVQVRADLLDDDVPLVLDLGLVEVWPDHELAQHLHGGRRMARRDPHVVDGRLAVRRGVEGAAEALHRLRERACRGEGARPLEGQVLHEMGAPGLARGLVTRAGEDVRLHREGAGPRQARRDDTRPVGQHRFVRTPRKGSPNDTPPDGADPSAGSRAAILGMRSHPVTGPIAARHHVPCRTARSRPLGQVHARRRGRRMASPLMEPVPVDLEAGRPPGAA